METAIPITVEQFRLGSITCPGGEVWYRFTVPTSGTYTIYTIESLDTIGYLYDCCGNQLNDNDNGCFGREYFKMVQDLFAGQTYYVRVTAYAQNTGSYQIVVTSKTVVSAVYN